MPDIATALRQALDDWEPPTAAPAPTKEYFSVTNNVTRVTFDYVRDNPGKTRKEVALALGTQGFKASSVTSLLGQMRKQGLMRESAHLLYVTTNEYRPLKSAKVLKARAAKPQAQQRKIVTITRRAAPVAEPTLQINAVWDAEALLNSLSITQARALYDALRKIFGG
jgi:hypothetical protein